MAQTDKLQLSRSLEYGEQNQAELVKLANGERIPRVSDSTSGLSLEMKLDVSLPVLRQKKKLLAAFEAALQRAALTVA
jgi:hypothetical protein